jgi:hypothetical protein
MVSLAINSKILEISKNLNDWKTGSPALSAAVHVLDLTPGGGMITLNQHRKPASI